MNSKKVIENVLEVGHLIRVGAEHHAIQVSVSIFAKSWRAAGVDVDAVVGFLSSRDLHASMQLRLMADFGMHPEQAVRFKPHHADQGHHIIVYKGTNRWNDELIRIETCRQRATLDAAKAMVAGVHGHVGHRGDTLDQALRRFRDVLDRHGITRKRLRVTMEGLRYEYFLRRAEHLKD